MSGSVLETVRSSLEEMEKLEKVCSKFLLEIERKRGTLSLSQNDGAIVKKKSRRTLLKKKEELRLEHCALFVLDMMREKANFCVSYFDDNDKQKRDEAAFLAGEALILPQQYQYDPVDSKSNVNKSNSDNRTVNNNSKSDHDKNNNNNGTKSTVNNDDNQNNSNITNSTISDSTLVNNENPSKNANFGDGNRNTGTNENEKMDGDTGGSDTAAQHDKTTVMNNENNNKLNGNNDNINNHTIGDINYVNTYNNKSTTDVWSNYYLRLKQHRDSNKKLLQHAANSNTILQKKQVLLNMQNITNVKKSKNHEEEFIPMHLSLALNAQQAATRPEIRDVNQIFNEIIKIPFLDGLFSDEEAFGSCLDFHSFYTMFLNYKSLTHYRNNSRKREEMNRLRKKNMIEDDIKAYIEEHVSLFDLDYITYLKTYSQFNDIPRSFKYKKELYYTYVQDLYNYLNAFFEKRNPLVDTDKIAKEFEESFEEQWKKKSIVGWEKYTHEMGFFCEATDSLMLSEGTFESHKKGKVYKKALEKNNSLSEKEKNEKRMASESYDKDVAFFEFLIKKYSELLDDVLTNTLYMNQKKQSRTADTLEEKKKKKKKNKKKSSEDDENNEEEDDDDDDDEEDDDEEDDDEDEIEKKLGKDLDDDDDDEENEDEAPIYNPLNLPLGFDGRPIPYWLYRLHGLGKEYVCEICGNASYWGRRAFELHFHQWRHALGMQCLKIPNTKHFKEITKIEDAIRLYEKLKNEADLTAFRPEVEMECEDSEGNVMNLRAYEDLRRQGLL